jgi:S-DNA-T family DNA segregation ATPase FtsK/SpoIIIE
VSGSGLEAQVAAGADGLAALPARGTSGPPPIARLAARIELSELDPPPDDLPHRRGDGVLLPVGRSFDHLATAVLAVPAGDHVLVAGTPRTGISSAVQAIAAAWLGARPDGRVIHLGRSSGRDTSPLADRRPPELPVLVCIDEAHRVEDTDGHVLAAIHGDLGDVTVVAGGRFDALRAAYGHWTKELARSRCGVILTSTGEIDGDLLGVSLPRRAPIAARPGLGWMIDGDGARLVQLGLVGPAAGVAPATPDPRPERLYDRIRSER